MTWQSANLRQAVKVVQCGLGRWDEQDHGLDFPHEIETTDFKVTGTGDERIERIHKDCRADRRLLSGFNEKQLEHRIAAWICGHARSFVLFNTKARTTVIGFEREEDAEAFGREFVVRGS